MRMVLVRFLLSVFGMKRQIAQVLLVSFAWSAFAGSPIYGRKLVWSDEFNGTNLDLSKWRFRQTMGSKSDEYVNDERTVRLEDGMLHL